MKKRTRYLLHRAQFKTTVSVMGVAFLGVAIILSLIVFSVNYNHSQLQNIVKKNSLIIQRIDNIAAIQDNVVGDLLAYSHMIRDPRHKLIVEEFAMDHYRNITTIKKNITDTKNNNTAIDRIIHNNNILLVVIIIAVIMQGVVLYYIGIRISHKYTGPLIVISRFLRDFIDKKDPALRPLRKGDELQKFYDLFAEAVEVVQERERRLIRIKEKKEERKKNKK